MLFNSVEYLLLFLIALIAGWKLVPWPRLRVWALLAASGYFYGANNGWLLVLIAFSTQLDYLIAQRIEDSHDPVVRRRLLWVSMAGNLGLLAFFKYFNFFMDSVTTLGALAGLNGRWVAWEIVLPVGISFYTFQTMSYTIDVYRGDLKAQRSWPRFALFVTYFPQLVAGPIVRARELLPQLERPRLDLARLESGLGLVALGLFKKIVLADFLATWADRAFDHPEQVDALGAWLGLYAFTFQIYYDFSGYSDIAIGCARLMGYELSPNFALPYAATSFSDFWRRWHISLSTWLRDYLYIPLGGNRDGRAARNVMITMLLGGLWHGAAWHFVMWGALHGVYLVIERKLGWRDAGASTGVALALRRIAVFQGVVLTWLLFRAQDMAHLSGLSAALSGHGRAPTQPVTWGAVAATGLIVAGLVAQWVGVKYLPGTAWLRLPLPLKALGYAAVAVLVCVFNSAGPRSFIYFAF